jgi:hypothetical protein
VRQYDGRLHFGLAEHGKVDRITVTWPSGTIQTLKAVAVDQVITVTEK